MRFSEEYGVEAAALTAVWFDPLLTTDTCLFVDPFRIFVDVDPFWETAHGRLIDFFNMVLELVAKSGGQRTSPHWHAAQRLLLFPEPHEFCLGYGEATTLGAGAGRGLQLGMLEGALTGIQLGIESVDHFEELTLFEAGIGADRVSDIVCNVQKAEFIEFTQQRAKELEIPLADVPVLHASWSRDYIRWMDKSASLPVNPFTKRGVLLTPKRFLRDLPSVNPDEFWEWSWANANEEIRGAFNYDIARNLDREVIARFARQNPHLAKRYVRHVEEDPKEPYDLEADPAGEVQWYEHGARFAEAVNLKFIATEPADFCDFVGGIVGAFVQNVEHEDGWRLLWNNGRNRPERIVQALFRSTVVHYSRANNIDLSGEANAGRGPVDFKFSKGWERRALIEVKLVRNSRFTHGLQTQVVQYLEAEDAPCALFVAVAFTDAEMEAKRLSEVRELGPQLAGRKGRDIRVVVVDGRKKPSASRA